MMKITPKNIVLIKFLLCSILPLICFSQESISLNGEWKIIFDEENEGRALDWMKVANFDQQAIQQDIVVPSCWELIKEDYEGVAFYKHEFQVPSNWDGKFIHLQFDAVNYLSEVWLNDEVVGFHEGGFTPFEFRVDEMIKTGEKNTLILRVAGPLILSEKEVDGVKKMETPQWRGGIVGGIWQDVRLVATGNSYINDVYIIPNIHDNSAAFQIEIEHSAIKGANVDILIKISEAKGNGRLIAELQETWSLHSGTNKQSWALNIPDAIYWSPKNPNLYKAEIRVSENGIVSDSWSERFGMRELTIKDKDFNLNGEPIYIKATFFEGLYPNGIAFPDSEEMIREEIRLAQEAGFNMIRPWRRPPAPIWLDIADEMGVLVVGSPALECMTLPRSTPYLPQRVENEIRETILRDRNRACIVQWELFNELHRPVLKQLMRPMAMLTRDLDPTRLILDESGGWAFGANMYLPNEFEPTQFNDIHNYPGPFIEEGRYDGYLSIGLTDEEKEKKGFSEATPGRNVVPGLMSFVSELGYGSLPDLSVINEQFENEGNPLTPAYRYHKRLAKEQAEVIQESGFSSLYPDMQKFYLDQQAIHGAANKRMIEAVRANPEVDGYCIHALAAGDWILGAGLIDLWRKPKSYAYEGTKAANQDQILSIRVIPRNIYTENGARIEIIGINDLVDTNAKLVVDVKSESGKTVYSKNENINYKHGPSSLLIDELATKKWKGNYVVNARIVSSLGTEITANDYDFDVFRNKDLKFPKAKIAVLHANEPLAKFLTSKKINVISFNQSLDISIPVFATGTLKKDEEKKGTYQSLIEFAKKGGTVVYIDGASKATTSDQSVFPFSTLVHPGRGLWTCIPHLVHDHPFFKGLPVNDMMRNEYENIWPTNTLRNMKVDGENDINTIVGSIGFDWFSREHRLHYKGPGGSWWGADVAEFDLGKGRCIVSQLRLVDNLGKDPVADKVLSNMIAYLLK